MHEPLPPALEAFRNRLGADLIETHISWLFLGETSVYKVKKPVTFPFVDYGSPERRHFFCEEELRLNRRFAPAMYLDLVAIDDSDEWAVHMTRFDEAQRLDHVCARGELGLEQLSDLARAIVDFHAEAAVAGPAHRFGEPAQVLGPALNNFTEMAPLLPEETDRLARLETWTRMEFTRCRESMVSRKREGRVRECHGDLHLGNLVLLKGRVTLFDCIEFNEDFRWIDVASEVAFTYVDLLDHQRPDLAAWLLNEWLSSSGDFSAVPVLRFYATYRALVRAKVAAFCGDKEAARAYLSMAESLVTLQQPRLTITFGLSGSGKSLSSQALLLADPAASTLRLRSDVERKRLHGMAALGTSRSVLDGGLYTPESSARTYSHLVTVAGRCLIEGWSIIVDAAFLQHAQRDPFRALAASQGVDFQILACTAPLEELRRRILSRQGDPSEATLDILSGQLSKMEPLDPEELAAVVTLSSKPRSLA